MTSEIARQYHRVLTNYYKGSVKKLTRLIAIQAMENIDPYNVYLALVLEHTESLYLLQQEVDEILATELTDFNLDVTEEWVERLQPDLAYLHQVFEDQGYPPIRETEPQAYLFAVLVYGAYWRMQTDCKKMFRHITVF